MSYTLIGICNVTFSRGLLHPLERSSATHFCPFDVTRHDAKSVNWPQSWLNMMADEAYLGSAPQTGEMANSFRLVSVVSHIGNSSSSVRKTALPPVTGPQRALAAAVPTFLSPRSHRSLCQRRLWHEEAVLAYLQRSGRVANSGVGRTEGPRPERVHILLHAKVSLSPFRPERPRDDISILTVFLPEIRNGPSPLVRRELFEELERRGGSGDTEGRFYSPSEEHGQTRSYQNQVAETLSSNVVKSRGKNISVTADPSILPHVIPPNIVFNGFLFNF